MFPTCQNSTSKSTQCPTISSKSEKVLSVFQFQKFEPTLHSSITKSFRIHAPLFKMSQTDYFATWLSLRNFESVPHEIHLHFTHSHWKQQSNNFCDLSIFKILFEEHKNLFWFKIFHRAPLHAAFLLIRQKRRSYGNYFFLRRHSDYIARRCVFQIFRRYVSVPELCPISRIRHSISQRRRVWIIRIHLRRCLKIIMIKYKAFFFCN